MSNQIKIVLGVGIVLIIGAAIFFFAQDCGGEETTGTRGVSAGSGETAE